MQINSLESRCEQSLNCIPGMDANTRNSNERQIIVESLTPCDRTSYLYFSIALLLFTFGAVITFIAIEEPNLNLVDRVWYFGPLLITSGLMVGVKTLIYLKRKSLIALITRQRLIVENENNSGIARNTLTQSSSLLPSYEESVLSSQTCAEIGPPSYEEALLISSLSRDEKSNENEMCA